MDVSVAEHGGLVTSKSLTLSVSPNRPTFLVRKSLSNGTQARENTKRLAELAGYAPEMVAASIRQHLESEDTMVKEVEKGMLAGYPPELVQDCCGGTYLMANNAGETVAVFKPADEEPYAPENPKGYVGGEMYGTSPLKEGVEVGMAAERECAAYMLDHGHRAKVPHTVMLRTHHTRSDLKYGSLQKFISNMCSSEDMGPSKFESADVHNIAMLDIRLCNSDRHPGNILVTPSVAGKHSLIPIDHGFVLPKWRYLHDLDFCWLHWPQSKEPLTEDDMDYIDQLDADADAAFIRNALSLAEDCLRTVRIGTLLLKLGAHEGLNLHEIGSLMIRPHHDERSVLEEEVWRSEEATLKEMRRYPKGLMQVLATSAGHESNGHAEMESSFMRHLNVNLGVAVRAKLAARLDSPDYGRGRGLSDCSAGGGLAEVLGELDL